MATKFSEVQASPGFQALDLAGQNAVKQRYFNNVVAKDSSFIALDSQGKQALRTRFFGAQVLSPPQQINQQPQAASPEAVGLFKQLGGKFPTQEPEPTTVTGLPFGAAPIVAPDTQEIQRRKAFSGLQQMGFSREHIGSGLAFEAGLKPPSTLPRIAGATIGSLAALGLGAFIPGPEELATVPAAAKIGAEIVGAGLGGATGRALQVAADPDESFTFGEFARVFGEEAALEALSIVTVGGGRRVLSGAKRTLVPEGARLSAQLVDAGERAGVKGRRIATTGFLTKARTRFLPAQFSENQLIDTVQSIGEGSLVGSNVIFQFKRGQKVALKQLEKELAETFLKGAEKRGNAEMGAILFDTITGKQKAFKETASQLYGAIDDISGGVRVDITDLKRFAQAEIDRGVRAGGVGQTPTSRTLLNRIVNLDDVDFRTGQDIKSGLGDIIRKGESKLTPDPKSVGLGKQLIGRMDNAMERAAKSGPQGLFEKWRAADKFFKTGSLGVNSKIIRRLTRKLIDEPEIAARAIFQPRSSRQIQLVKKVAGKKTFNELRSTWLEQLLKDSASKEVGEEGELLGKTFLNKFNNMGDDTLKAIFTPTEIGQIRDLGKTAAILQKRTGGVGGSLKILQGVAAFGLVASPFLPEGEFRNLSGTAAGMILLGPAVIARMMTNPTSARLLSEGFKLGTGTRQGVALTARLIKDVLRTRAAINKQEAKRQRRLALPSREAQKRQLTLSTGGL